VLTAYAKFGMVVNTSLLFGKGRLFFFFFPFSRVLGCSFLEGIKWPNQIILIHNLMRLTMYRTQIRPQLDNCK